MTARGVYQRSKRAGFSPPFVVSRKSGADRPRPETHTESVRAGHVRWAPM
jgi:hypothetical protein